MRKVSILFSVTLIITFFSSSVFAAFADLSLIRVVYERTSGTVEYATDLGNVNTIITSNAITIAGTDLLANNANNLFIAYFALDRHASTDLPAGDSTPEMWVSGSTDITKAPVAVATQGMNQFKNGTNNIYGYYNSLTPIINGVVSALQSNGSSYKSKLTATQGALGNAINIATRVNTEAKLTTVVNGTAPSVTQNLYYFANGNTSNSRGVPVAAITTRADGSTYILPNATITADITPPQIDKFEIASPSADSYIVSGITFVASDISGVDTINKSNISGVVSGYMITESATPPLATDPAWSATPPSSYTFTSPFVYGTPTTKTMYAWVKDLNGNVSTKQNTTSVTVTSLVDSTPPKVTAFSPPSTSSSVTINGITFTATDDSVTGVTGYLITESNATPPLDATGWTQTAPTSYTVNTAPTVGVPTDINLYAWAKDTAGNMSTPGYATVTITASAGDATPPVTTITTPAPLTATSATVSIDVTATDDIGVTASMLSESATPPAPDSADWVAITPAVASYSATLSHTFSGIVPDTLTPKTLYVWIKDAAGNVSAEKSILINITIPVLTVTIVSNISGGGQVSSDVGGINCPTGNACNAPFDSVSIPGPVTLSATPDSDSLFTGWSNNIACDGLTGNCILTMSASQGVTATFDRLKLVRTTDGTTPKSYYGLVQNAFKTAVNTDVIQAKQHTFKENLTLNQTAATDVITLKGGYDSVFTDTPAGITTIEGKLTIKSGKLIVSGVAIKPTP